MSTATSNVSHRSNSNIRSYIDAGARPHNPELTKSRYSTYYTQGMLGKNRFVQVTPVLFPVTISEGRATVSSLW
jgi:hypothetical protein